MADEMVTIALDGEQSAVEELRAELDKIENAHTEGGTIEQWDGEGQQLVSLVIEIAPVAIPAVSAIIMALIRRRKPGEIRGLTVDGKTIKVKEGDADGLAKVIREMNQKDADPKKRR